MPLIRLFLDICLFRKGPQDVPASRLLVQVTLAVYLLVGLVLMTLETQWPESVLMVLMQGAMLLAFIWISLMAAGKINRFMQTATTMLGTDALISSFAIPMIAALAAYPQLVVISWLLLFWQMAVIAHILRHALSQTLPVALALVIVYVFFTIEISSLLLASLMASG